MFLGWYVGVFWELWCRFDVFVVVIIIVLVVGGRVFFRVEKLVLGVVKNWIFIDKSCEC